MTNQLEARLASLAADLSELEVHWALVGGLAVSVRAEPRFTRDIDVAVAVADDDEAEDLVRRIGDIGYRVVLSLEQEATGRLATVRLEPDEGSPEGVVIDVLFASSGIESEVVAHATPVEVVPGMETRVARAGHLLALKLLSTDESRPLDAADVRALVSQLDGDERVLATSAVDLIIERGCNRGRDLRSALSSALAAE